MNTLEKNVQLLLQRCNGGIKGKYFLYPNIISGCLTNKCNLNCIMCTDIEPDFENHTAGNAEPFAISLKEFRKTLPKRSWIKKLLKTPSDKFFNNPIQFEFMVGETFLNPETYDIVKHIKKQYKNSTINILSNGTVPPQKGKEDIVNYIDILGFSIDGCTKETFEMIRRPAKFEQVINSIKRWSEMRLKYNSNIKLRFAITLSKMNFHELPGLVQLAHDIGGFDSVYVQPLLTNKTGLEFLEPQRLNHIDKEEGRKYLKEAFRVSKETGIYIKMFESIKQMFGYHEDDQKLTDNQGSGSDNTLSNETPSINTIESTETQEELKFDFNLNRYCQMPSNLRMGFDEKGKLRFVCCFMLDPFIIDRYHIPRRGSPFKIYNSKGYWQLRKDMLEGKLIEECKHCTAGNSDYYRLRDNEINSV